MKGVIIISLMIIGFLSAIASEGGSKTALTIGVTCLIIAFIIVMGDEPNQKGKKPGPGI